MLHEFLAANREELIRRCAAKVAQRNAPAALTSEPRHGVPLFLDQLGEALGRRQASGADALASAEGTRTATLHGEQMQEEGYSVDQVVHDYGDLCQSITELAREQGAPVTVDEFQVLNRMLDNAIADAVSSYEFNRELRGSVNLHQRLGTLAEAQRKHLDVALEALAALKAANLGLSGATGTLLEDSLVSLRDSIDKSHPELRLSSGMATTPQA